MDFKELKSTIIKARDMAIKGLDFYNNTVFHINKENYQFRCTLNRMSIPEFELIKPNKDYVKMHPGAAGVKIEFITHPWNRRKESSQCEEVKSLEKFCDILGWDDHNLKEFENYLKMYIVERI